MFKTVTYQLLILLMFTGGCKSQQTGMSTKNNKAAELYDEAMKDYRLMYYEKAFDKLDQAIEKDEEFFEAYVLKATIYRDVNKLDRAVEHYQKALNIDPDYEPRVYFELGMVQNSMLELDGAKKNFEKFLSYENTSFRLQKTAENELELTEFRKDLMDNPVPFDPENLGPGVNGPYLEHSPTLTADEQKLFFTKNEAPFEGARRNEYIENIYFSLKQKDGSWGRARRLGKEINSDRREGAATISPDGNYLIFTSCQRPEGHGSCDLYIASKRGEKWVNARNMGKQINTQHWESQPSFGGDGRTLYFTSNRPESKGERDIYMTRIDDNGRWSKPKSISLSTTGNEASPFIHPDNKTFYFASDGYPGMGKRDLFVVEVFGPDSFGEPQNLGYPINGPGDEVSLSVAPSGKKAYYASEREEGFGMWDLYSFELPEHAKPTPVTYAKGKVRDRVSGEPVQAKFEMLIPETGERIIESYSDPETGEFLVVVPTDKQLVLNVSTENHLFFSEKFSPSELNNEKPYAFDVVLEPVEEGKAVVLKNIFFDTDKYELKDASQAELQKLVQFMQRNEDTHIEIGGHTDNVGSEQYNKELSENRAKSVYEFLINEGIEQERLSFKGYAFSNPVADNNTEEGRAQNRRIEFKVTKK